jgi:hypothetical protein
MFEKQQKACRARRECKRERRVREILSPYIGGRTKGKNHHHPTQHLYGSLEKGASFSG